MGRSWTCDQCGETTATGLTAGGPPDACPTCGNDAFTELGEPGPIDRLAAEPDRVVSDPTTRRRALVGGGLVAAAVAGGWWVTRPTVADDSNVAIRNSQFAPRNVEIEQGTTVVWSNEEAAPEGGQAQTYDLRSATDGWTFEETVQPGSSVEHTFDESGVYAVYAPGFGDPDLTGMSMKIGVDRTIDEPLGG